MKSQSVCIMIFNREPTQNKLMTSLKILSPNMCDLDFLASLSRGNLFKGTIGEVVKYFAEASSILSFDRKRIKIVKPKTRCLLGFG
jgi:hypothetical protein